MKVTCCICSAIFNRNVGAVKQNNYCSKSCYQERCRRLRESAFIVVTCKFCSKPVRKYRKELARNSNTFCNRICVAKYRVSKFKRRYKHLCKICGKETNATNACSQNCYNLYLEFKSKKRTSLVIAKWELDHVGLPKAVKEYLKIQSGYKCSQCGWNKANPVNEMIYLDIDHIDGNSDNNVPENLRVLCKSCHTLTPTYTGLNNRRQ